MNLVDTEDVGIAPEVAMDKLFGMESADELARFFEDQGVKASCGEPFDCAISKWMEQTTGCATYSTVFTIKVTTGEEILDFDPTAAMCSFIWHFDQGHYPELEKEYE